MDCNDRNVKGFVGYKYPTYAYCLTQRTRACVPHTPYTLVLKFLCHTQVGCVA